MRRSDPAPTVAPLPEGVLPADRALDDHTVVYSLTAHALAEMERHRWFTSEASGRDLGYTAHHDWLRTCWRGWVRSKLLEHLYGWRRWSAFGTSQFALLRRSTVEREVPHDVLHEVASILGEGGENLDIIDWAVRSEQPMACILWLLERIDINSARQRLLEDHIRLFLPPLESNA